MHIDLSQLNQQRSLLVRYSSMKVILNQTMLICVHGGMTFSSTQLYVSWVHTYAKYKVNSLLKRVFLNFSTNAFLCFLPSEVQIVSHTKHITQKGIHLKKIQFLTSNSLHNKQHSGKITQIIGTPKNTLLLCFHLRILSLQS